MKSLMKWDYHENENEILTCLYVWYEKEWNNYLFEITKIPYSFNDLKKKIKRYPTYSPPTFPPRSDLDLVKCLQSSTTQWRWQSVPVAMSLCSGGDGNGLVVNVDCNGDHVDPAAPAWWEQRQMRLPLSSLADPCGGRNNGGGSPLVALSFWRCQCCGWVMIEAEGNVDIWVKPWFGESKMGFCGILIPIELSLQNML